MHSVCLHKPDVTAYQSIISSSIYTRKWKNIIGCNISLEMIYNILRGGSKRGRRARGSSPWIPPLSLPSFLDERMKRKGWGRRREEEEKEEEKGDEPSLRMCARFATARKRCSSFGDKPGFAHIFFPHAVWILLLKASEFSCLQKQEPGSLTKFAMQKCTCQKKFDTYLVGIQKVAHHLKLPTFW